MCESILSPPPPFRSSVSPSSTAAGPLIERDVDVDIKTEWCELAPTAPSVASMDPAYTVGSARSELRRIWTQMDGVPPCAHPHMDGYSTRRCALARAVGDADGECAGGGARSARVCVYAAYPTYVGSVVRTIFLSIESPFPFSFSFPLDSYVFCTSRTHFHTHAPSSFVLDTSRVEDGESAIPFQSIHLRF
ncbi:hypothetical protein B0H13DRAFT_2358587 [Mycena leptocephala]|nr:hypothetical protein B0H13DRAFT_2358587 [Mycena leptocephala]